MSSQELPYGLKIENQINSNGNNLPFGYYEPTSGGKVTWNCGYDQDNKITSVFSYINGESRDRRSSYLDTLQDAQDTRRQLIEAGWLKMKPPKITFSYGDDKKKDGMNSSQAQKAAALFPESFDRYLASRAAEVMDFLVWWW